MSTLTTRVTHFEIDDTVFPGQASSITIKSKPNSFRAVDSMVAEFDYMCEITATQDLEGASLWSLMYEQVGQTVPVVLKPYGNIDAPSPDQPWVSVTAIVTQPDGDLIGGGPDASTTTRRTFQVSWDCDRPLLITTD